jgi:hypothetical protein
MVEVKFSEYLAQSNRVRWFIRSTLTKAAQQAERYNRTAGGDHVEVAVFMRAARSPWRVFVPDAVARRAWGVQRVEAWTAWVEFGPEMFFTDIARSVIE